jgi:hypothetical protein
MHFRRLSAFVLGAWLVGSLFVAFLASQNFANASRILNDPPRGLLELAPQLTREQLSLLFRFAASEANRFMFETWGVVQLGLSSCLIALSVFSPRRSLLLIGGAMALLVMVMVGLFYLIPEMNQLGRRLDFRHPAEVLELRDEFRTLHFVYFLLEAVKCLLLLLLAGRLSIDRAEWRHAAQLRAERRREAAGVHTRN